MGLGKTIETLACIMSHPNTSVEQEQLDFSRSLDSTLRSEEELEQETRIRCYCGPADKPNRQERVQCEQCSFWQHASCVSWSLEGPYRCPNCCFQAKLKVPSHTTLIISPTPIIEQWRQEILQRTKSASLKVLIYDGISKIERKTQLGSPRKEGHFVVLPQHLAEYDIVLTSFDVLRTDLRHSFVRENVSRRENREERYRSLPTPLIGLKWWRVCIDEAQMVSSGMAKAATMALQLESTHRWCISGTPIQKRGLEDLQGLFMFLKVPLLSNPQWFHHHFSEPMEYKESREEALSHLLEFCRPLMWRSSKGSVRAELDIPPQSELTHLLTLSSVENFNYQMLHQQCVGEVQNVLAPRDRLTYQQNDFLMRSLLRLRQACCHPQIGSQFAALQIQQTPLSMEEILEQLTMRAKVDCELSQREWISVGCDLAGIELNDATCNNEEDSAVRAAKLYWEMIRVGNENEISHSFDAYQKMHLLYNFGVTLGYFDDDAGRFSDAVTAQLGHTVTVATLKGELDRLTEDQIVTTRELALSAALSYHAVHLLTQELIASAEGPCWGALLELLSSKRKKNTLLRYLWEVLDETNGMTTTAYHRHPKCLRHRFSSVEGLFDVIKQETAYVYSSYQVLGCVLKEDTPSDDTTVLETQVQELVYCPCRSQGGVNLTTEKCHSCSVFRLIGELTQLCYFDATLGREEPQADGFVRVQHDSELWVMNGLISILPSLFPTGEASPLVNRIKLEVEILRAIKKEIRPLIKQWKANRNYFLAEDEARRSLARISLSFEPESAIREKLATAWVAVEASKCRFRFLCKLSQKGDENRREPEGVEDCAVCLEPVSDEFVLLGCSHKFCAICINRLMSHSPNVVKCPSCRFAMNSREIAFIAPPEKMKERTDRLRLSCSSSADLEDIWGTKIGAIVNEILRLMRENPQVKALVFSQWNQVLELVHLALAQTDIEAVLLKSGSQREQKAVIHDFREGTPSVLLLPLNRGANGLNLVEATHVFLVEPLLNPSAEAQAIARVDRIGQNQPTTVHRFIVQNTVEKRIHQFNQLRKGAPLEAERDRKSTRLNSSHRNTSRMPSSA